MHPSFNMRNISLLPRSHQGVATAAANGDSVALKTLVNDITCGSLRTTRVLFLPVFCVHLDVARIESVADELTHSGLEAVCRAFQSITGLQGILEDLPSDTFPQLWPGVWAWTQFMTQDPGCMPVDVAAHEVYVTILDVLGSLRDERMTTQLMEGEDGFRHFVARSWAIIVEMDDAERLLRKVGLLQICNFLRIKTITNPVQLEDLIHGSGGTPAHLASLVAKFIGFFSVNEGQDVFNLLQYGLNFINRVEMACSDFRGAILGVGVVRVVTEALCKVCSYPKFDRGLDHGALQLAFQFLGNMIITSPGYPWITEALSAGLLRAIVTFGIYDEHVDPELLAAVLKTISKYTVYYSVLQRMEASLLEAAGIADSEAFQKSPISGAWSSFTHIVRQRLRVKKLYDSDEHISMKACDNAQCHIVGQKLKFQSCAACHSVYYCSPTCQLIDWRVGGHRARCKKIRSHSLMNPNPIGTRNRSFLRAVLHTEYEENRCGIILCQLAFMSESPGMEFLTMFDYVDDGACRIRCIPMDQANQQDLSLQLEDCVARALVSEGRMVLHLMIVAEGKDRCHIIPLRAADKPESPDFRAEMVEIAKDIPPGTGIWKDYPQILQRITALIDEHRESGIH
ncbi:hypothetical protein B0H13DRAFT_2666161 [Mycena leptocephala]|nr:hypothetical protein B0H13DRAFT_2666161 [Mycena leptocephala]